MDSINLDPTDWDEFRRTSHIALDLMIDHLRTIRERPVWRPAPENIRDSFLKSLPRGSRELADVLAQFDSDIRPYVTGNAHPLFMGWVHGAGTPVGMIAEMLAAGLNANCGGRNHIAHDVERQVTRWVAEALGLPAESSGLLVTGSSMANFIGLLVARTNALGTSVRRTGIQATNKRLVAYASCEAHQCIGQAMELAGLGSGNLRLVATNSAREMRADLLAAAIDEDRRAGLAPFLVVGSAGTVNSGSIDPLDAIAGVAHENGLWFHVDGAIGAGATLSPQLRSLMKGIERADSVALDFHKWMHVPYDAGFIVVRDSVAHLQTFASEAAYLSRAANGLAAGDIWPCDLGPDLSRGFRALKTWMTFETLGADRIGACMEQNCVAARHLAGRLEADGLFELCAPVALNIVCFSAKNDRADAINRWIVEDLHVSGEAAPSLTTIDGRTAIRAAIVNHRTTIPDIDAFVTSLRKRVLAGSN